MWDQIRNFIKQSEKENLWQRKIKLKKKKQTRKCYQCVREYMFSCATILEFKKSNCKSSELALV